MSTLTEAPSRPETAATTGRAATGATVLEANDLYRFYHAGEDETLALRGVSVRLDRGEVVAVTGPSGSGKSTLLACLAGLDEPDGGMVRCNGAAMSRQSEQIRARLRGAYMGMLFQSNNLVEHLSVIENVNVALRLAGVKDRGRAQALLDRLHLGDRANARPTTLSGGESARAGLAVALANQPIVVLCDEPTGELDRGTAEHVLGLLRDYADEGNAVMIVTHDPTVAAFADREIRLFDGRVQT